MCLKSVGEAPVGRSVLGLEEICMEQGLSQKSPDGCGFAGMDMDSQGWIWICRDGQGSTAVAMQ